MKGFNCHYCNFQTNAFKILNNDFLIIVIIGFIQSIIYINNQFVM